MFWDIGWEHLSYLLVNRFELRCQSKANDSVLQNRPLLKMNRFFFRCCSIRGSTDIKLRLMSKITGIEIMHSFEILVFEAIPVAAQRSSGALFCSSLNLQGCVVRSFINPQTIRSWYSRVTSPINTNELAFYWQQVKEIDVFQYTLFLNNLVKTNTYRT